MRITHSETIEKEMILASTLGQAPKRTAEAHTLAVNLMDAKIETKAILSGNAVTTVVATSSQIGTVQVALKRGHIRQGVRAHDARLPRRMCWMTQKMKTRCRTTCRRSM